jgi:elongation factor Ts
LEISAQDVKKLREKTGSGLMDCKNALVKAAGDFVRAEKILKELGLAAAQKRSGRKTKEGSIFCRIGAGKGILLEVSCETDFVARSQDFKDLGASLCQVAMEKGGELPREVSDGLINAVVGRIKENMELRRYQVLDQQDNDLLIEYIHGGGQIGVIVKLSLSNGVLKDNPRVKETGFDLALHAAAFAPIYLSRDKVDPTYLEEQEEIFLKQAQNLGKPEKVLAGIVKGKLNKHISEICFVDQPFVKDNSLKVSQLLKNLSREIGGEVEITDYLYFRVGEELG